MEDKVNIIQLSQASSLAKIISSKTAQEMIEFIDSNDECSATDIKNKLNLPASTVHYNLKALCEAQIIDDSKFTYSKKGKQIIHYSLTNKILIIIPKKQNISNQLKAFIPGLLTVGGIIGFGFIMKLFNKGTRSLPRLNDFSSIVSNEIIVESSARSMADEIPKTLMQEAVPIAAKATPLNSINIINQIPWYQTTEFFTGLVIASVCIIGAFIIINYLRKNK